MDHRTLRAWEWVAEYADTRGAPLTLSVICAACAERSGMGSAWVTGADPATEPAVATDPVAEDLADLQVLLGEGPTADAGKDGRAVAATDLATVASRQSWPMFAQAAVTAGVRCWSFPSAWARRESDCSVSIRGCCGCSRSRGEPRSTRSPGPALGLPLDQRGWLADTGSPHRAEIHQATGIVSVQLGLDVAESLVCLRAHAFAQARPLSEVAREVVTRRLRFSPNTPEGGFAAP